MARPAAAGAPRHRRRALTREAGEPLLQEVEAIKAEGPDLVTVVIGEFVPTWWQHGLHNHRALQMKARLLFEPGVAAVSVPHHA